MSHEALLARIASVPHLKLLDLGEQLGEVRQEVLDAFREAGQARMASFSVSDFNLHVSGILDYGDDPLTSGQYLDHLDPQLRRGGITPTRVGRRTPRLLQLVDRITRFKGRVRLSKLPAGQSVRLHDHKYKEFILHLPLITHRDVQMAVVINGQETRRHYAPGELWHFNAFHQHAVYNRSPIDRYHVWCGFPVKVGDSYNDRLFDLLEAALVRAD